MAAAAATDEGALRLFHTGRTLLATAAPLPPGLDALRARGLALVTLRSGAVPGILTGVKATSYASSMAAVAQPRARAPTTRSFSETTRRCSS